MTPEKQVSPAIRILRGERDASARATHLEAATRKFLVTTNERKQMSSKTNFKRIALVAVAALGLGVLSSVPSNAVFSGTAGSQIGITITNGTGTLSAAGARSDSTTAGIITASGLALTTADSFTVTTAKKSWPAITTAAATPVLNLALRDTLTSTGASLVVNNSTGAALNATGAASDSATLVAVSTPVSGGANMYAAASLYAFQDSNSATPRIAGTYVYTVIVTPISGTAQTADITITVAAAAADSLVANASFSTVFMGTSTGNASDVAVSALATASDTPRGYLTVKLRNASGVTNGAAARESVTITTTIGQVGTSTNRGRSVVLAYAGDTDYNIYSDGTAGSGTITISTPSVTFSTRTVIFYAAAPATLVASVPTPNLRVGTNADAVRVTARDANGNLWAGDLYAYASTAADALIAGSLTTPVLCTFDTGSDQRHECGITGTLAGTAKIKVINASTVAAATVTSNEVSVVVNSNPVASFKLSFDKASYAPSERARIYVTPVDSAGKEIAVSTTNNLLAAGGITTASSLSFGPAGTTQADSLTVVNITTAANSSSTSGARAGSAVYTVFMPASGGTVTITATGGSALPLAAQVAVTASATVTDSGAAALAAVTALSTTVASLKTLITTLTNLVLKIQKKVKA
jgi:hypothetical protein